ncbi:hypothetical protein Tco_0025697 [Tanacetum coccineum]
MHILQFFYYFSYVWRYAQFLDLLVLCGVCHEFVIRNEAGYSGLSVGVKQKAFGMFKKFHSNNVWTAIRRVGANSQGSSSFSFLFHSRCVSFSDRLHLFCPSAIDFFLIVMVVPFGFRALALGGWGGGDRSLPSRAEVLALLSITSEFLGGWISLLVVIVAIPLAVGNFIIEWMVEATAPKLLKPVRPIGTPAWKEKISDCSSTVLIVRGVFSNLFSSNHSDDGSAPNPFCLFRFFGVSVFAFAFTVSDMLLLAGASLLALCHLLGD